MKRHLLSISALLFVATGCSSLKYSDPNETETVNIDFGSTDLQTFGSDQAESFLVSPGLKYYDTSAKGQDKRVVAVQGGIQNETSEHINTAQILRKMNDTIVKSGEVRLLAGAEEKGRDLIGEQQRFQQESGRVRADMAKDYGRQVGADVVIYGSLSDIRKKRGRSIASGGSKRKDVYFQLYMQAVDVETGEILWTEETEINKEERVSLFGRG